MDLKTKQDLTEKHDKFLEQCYQKSVPLMINISVLASYNMIMRLFKKLVEKNTAQMKKQENDALVQNYLSLKGHFDNLSTQYELQIEKKPVQLASNIDEKTQELFLKKTDANEELKKFVSKNIHNLTPFLKLYYFNEEIEKANKIYLQNKCDISKEIEHNKTDCFTTLKQLNEVGNLLGKTHKMSEFTLIHNQKDYINNTKFMIHQRLINLGIENGFEKSVFDVLNNITDEVNEKSFN